ncbi:MAG: carbohydrate porin [Prevotellaceae bacterium]|nr:carbohydrate porin [Prevotellaceae bacterium]
MVNASECVIELTYHFQLNENIYFSPDFQYIINPAGTSEILDNAFVGMLRFGVKF